MKRIMTMQKVWAFMVAFAIVLASLAPTLAHSSKRPDGIAEGVISVCTTTGLKWLDVQTGELRAADDGLSKSKGFVHCQDCLTHFIALPHSDLDRVSFVKNSSQSVFASLDAPPHQPLFFRQNNPRAPPHIA
jgi:hypothetical protein